MIDNLCELKLNRNLLIDVPDNEIMDLIGETIRC